MCFCPKYKKLALEFSKRDLKNSQLDIENNIKYALFVGNEKQAASLFLDLKAIEKAIFFKDTKRYSRLLKRKIKK